MRSLDEAVSVEIEDEESTGSNPQKTIALVAGAFRPPTRGHLEMVKQYADMADEVKIIVSQILKKGSKSKRYIGDTHLKKSLSTQIWQTMIDAAGLGDKVTLHDTPRASPVHAIYDYVGKDGDVQPNTHVLLGLSDKDTLRRYEHLLSKQGEIAKPGVTLEAKPVPASEHSEEYMTRLSEFPELAAGLPSENSAKVNSRDIHASDLRYLAENIEEPGAWELLQDFFPPESADAVLAHLDLKAPLEEMSGAGGGGGANAMSNGSIAGASGKVPGDTDEETKNNTIIREVMKLLKERGIVL